MVYTTNLDWLQIYCHGDNITCDKATGGEFKFSVKNTGKETMQFLTLLYIYVDKVKVAEILQNPRAKIIHEKATIVKIENQVLYTSQYMHIAYELIKAFNLHYKGITRLDICLDCQELAGGQEIQAFLRNTIALDVQEEGYIYNVGRAHSTYNMQLTNKTGNRITGVKWGSPRSAIHCYCYDKTLELIEVKDKPWIRDMWQRNGIDYQYNDDELYAMSAKQKERMVKRIGLADYVKKPVWRWEISIKADGKNLLDLETGEMFTLGLDDLENSKIIENLFFAYAARCFRFVQNTGQKNERNFTPVKIFDYSGNTTVRPIYWRYMKDTGRSEKICFNKLAKLKDLIPESEEDLNYHVHQTMQYIAQIANVKSQLYSTKKYLDARKSERSYKMMLLSDSLRWMAYEAQIMHTTDILPSQNEYDNYSMKIDWDDVFANDADAAFLDSLFHSVNNMHAPQIVIPEGAERLSRPIPQAMPTGSVA